MPKYVRGDSSKLHKKWFYFEIQNLNSWPALYGPKPINTSEEGVVDLLLTDHYFTAHLIGKGIKVYELSNEGDLVEKSDLVTATFEANNLFLQNRIEIIWNELSFESKEVILQNRNNVEIIEMILRKEGINLLRYFALTSNKEYQFMCTAKVLSIFLVKEEWRQPKEFVSQN